MASTSDQDTQRLLEALERQGAAPLRRIFELTSLKLAPKLVQSLAPRAAVFLSNLKSPKAEVLGLAIVSKPGEVARVVASDELLVSLLKIRAVTTKTRAHTPAKLRDMLPKPQHAGFEAGLKERSASGDWPPGVAAVQAERSMLVFLIEHIQTHARPSGAVSRPAAVAPPRDTGFASVFERAFDELHDPRHSNLVALAALRARLSTYDRQQFDSGLRSLRESARYVLQTFDGRHGELSPELEAASIEEGGRRFVYVAKRSS